MKRPKRGTNKILANLSNMDGGGTSGSLHGIGGTGKHASPEDRIDRRSFIKKLAGKREAEGLKSVYLGNNNHHQNTNQQQQNHVKSGSIVLAQNSMNPDPAQTPNDAAGAVSNNTLDGRFFKTPGSSHHADRKTKDPLLDPHRQQVRDNIMDLRPKIEQIKATQNNASSSPEIFQGKNSVTVERPKQNGKAVIHLNMQK